MSERIDHAAKARAQVEAARASATLDGSTAHLTEAQVHATLALVEQQRVANLIAYASHRNDHRSAVGDANYPEVLLELLSAVDFDIREGLGL